MIPAPYFENDGITLYCGACQEILPELQSESFDMVVTDLPYLVRYSGRWGSDWGVNRGRHRSELGPSSVSGALEDIKARFPLRELLRLATGGCLLRRLAPKRFSARERTRAYQRTMGTRLLHSCPT